ncbi:MAG: hypothetical protein QXE79_03285 [Candidatus Bathyarchaeia archaeon]
MDRKNRPRIRCWVELIDPKTGKVVRRILANAESDIKEEKEVNE